jgi:uncharacterized membrane protein HdeD (DUF308 family)
MSDQQPATPQPRQRNIAHWVTPARSMLALALGLALIIHPEKSRPMLINFIGMFWLAAGIMSLRWGTAGERAQRVSVMVGIVGIVAGGLMLGRFLLAQVMGEEPIVLLIGVVVTLTGLVHVFEGFRTGADRQRRRSWISTLLGVFEIVLGVVVLLWRDDFGPVFYAAVVLWAFMAAFALLREALRQRTRASEGGLIMQRRSVDGRADFNCLKAWGKRKGVTTRPRCQWRTDLG